MATVTLPVPRKAIGTYQALKSPDGVSWSVVAHTLDSTKNEITVDIDAGDLVMLSMTAFAKQTKPSTNKPVLNGEKGLLGIVTTQNHSESTLAEAVAGITLKSDASGITTEQSNAVKFLVDEAISRIKTLANDMVAPANTSQAVKVAIYQISDSGQVNLGFIANTMTHNGTDWGELDEIIIPFGDLEVDSFNDANGTAQLAYSTMTELPIGWAHNYARAGEQIEGVDL